MIKLIIIIVYFLFGYICFKNGIDAFGGRDAYLMATKASLKDYYIMGIILTVFWPIFTIMYLIRKFKEKEE